MSEPQIVARSPVAPPAPVEVVSGWEVSGRRSGAALTLGDLTPLAKVLVVAPTEGPTAAAFGVRFGRARRDEHGLTIGSGPGEWLALSDPGTGPATVERLEALADDGEHVSVVDLTHGRALFRLTGERSPDVLAKVCAIDLDDAVTPQGAAFRTSVAKLVTDMVRDDRDGRRSYLLHCERSSGQYLFDALLDAGQQFDIDVDGFTSSR